LPSSSSHRGFPFRILAASRSRRRSSNRWHLSHNQHARDGGFGWWHRKQNGWNVWGPRRFIRVVP
jgi:hypothetical protein